MTLLAILKKWALAANLSLLFLTSFTKIGLSFKNNVIFFFFFFNNRLVIENTSGTKANNSFLFLITSHVKVPYCSCMFPQLRYKNQRDRYTRTSDFSPWFHGSSYVNGSKLLQGKWCKTEQGWTVWRDLQNVPCLFLRTSCTVCLSEHPSEHPSSKGNCAAMACLHATFLSERHEKFTHRHTDYFSILDCIGLKWFLGSKALGIQH